LFGDTQPPLLASDGTLACSWERRPRNRAAFRRAVFTAQDRSLLYQGGLIDAGEFSSRNHAANIWQTMRSRSMIFTIVFVPGVASKMHQERAECYQKRIKNGFSGVPTARNAIYGEIVP
jgi:hypothetical protein